MKKFRNGNTVLIISILIACSYQSVIANEPSQALPEIVFKVSVTTMLDHELGCFCLQKGGSLEFV